MAIDIPLHDKHVAFLASGVGPVPFLQDHNCVPHMPVQKLNPEDGPVCRYSITGNLSCAGIVGKDSQYKWDSLRGGGLPLLPPPAPPVPCRDDLGSAPAATLCLAPRLTLGAEHSTSAAPGMSDWPLIYVSHMQPLTFRQVCGMSVRPFLLSSANSSGG